MTKVSKNQAAAMQSKEAKESGSGRIAPGGPAATVQSLSDKGVDIKDVASKMQSKESRSHGGNVQSGGPAASLQSIADKTAK